MGFFARLFETGPEHKVRIRKIVYKSGRELYSVEAWEQNPDDRGYDWYSFDHKTHDTLEEARKVKELALIERSHNDPVRSNGIVS